VRDTNDVRRMVPRQKPETMRCNALSVSLTVDDLERSRKFYVDGLRFHVKDRWEQDGKLLGLELVAGGCMVGLSQDDWAKGRDRTKGVGMRMFLGFTGDLEALADGMRERGVDAQGPLDAPWGARVIHVVDPDGFTLTFFRETKA
jgi:catechol 2,3-dioxygenase-like lactoylglutathione lyase family enzyme